MSYGIRKDFYQSKAWKQVRKNIWIKQNLLCAICNKPVYVDGLSEYLPKEKRRRGIVHHKIWLDNNNIQDDNITLNEDNLIGICYECHEKIHHANMSCRKGLTFDEEGNIIPLAKGGTDDWNNLGLAHMRCNTIKRDTEGYVSI